MHVCLLLICCKAGIQPRASQILNKRSMAEPHTWPSALSVSHNSVQIIYITSGLQNTKHIMNEGAFWWPVVSTIVNGPCDACILGPSLLLCVSVRLLLDDIKM